MREKPLICEKIIENIMNNINKSTTKQPFAWRSIKNNISMVLPCPPPPHPEHPPWTGGGAWQNQWNISFLGTFKHCCCFFMVFYVFVLFFLLFSMLFYTNQCFLKHFFGFNMKLMVFINIPLISNSRWIPRDIQRHPETSRGIRKQLNNPKQP